MDPVIFVLWNVAIFIIYGTDKKRAINGRWRVSESFLITCAFCMGVIGSILGMIAFRHKIRKPKFVLMILLALVLNVYIIIR